MRITAKKLALTLVVGAIVVAMVAPAAALAVPGRLSATASRPTSATVADARGQMLEQRVMNALQNRARRFENYAAMLERQQERLMLLCEKVEAAGADCAEVREQIRLATQTMEQARIQERLAADEFRGVLEATDKRGAFGQAREQARVSVQTMKQSRDQLKTAARTLQGLVEDLLDQITETESE
jgi:hypothetical protein